MSKIILNLVLAYQFHGMKCGVSFHFENLKTSYIHPAASVWFGPKFSQMIFRIAALPSFEAHMIR